MAPIDHRDESVFRWGLVDVVRRRLEVLGLLRIAERRLIAVLVLATVAAGVLPLLFTASIGLLVGLIPDVVRDGFASRAGHLLIWSLTGMAIVVIAQQVVGPLQGALEGVCLRQIDESFRAKTLNDLSRPRGVGHLEDPTLMDHLFWVKEGVLDFGASPGGAAVLTIRLIGAYLQGIGGAIFIGVAFSWWAAAGLLAVCLLSRALMRRGLFEYLSVWRGDPEQVRSQRRADYSTTLGIGPMTAKESRIFGLTDWLVDRFRRDWGAAMRKPAQIQRRLLRGVGVAYGTLGIAYSLLFVSAGDAAARGALELGALAVVVQASFNLSDISDHGPWDTQLELGTSVLPKVRELEEQTARAADGAGQRSPSADVPSDEIRFEGVSFRYPGSDHDALRDLDLSIPAGQPLAIVGPNGAGKTTIVKLLAGLYDPLDGRIVVDGVDLREIEAGAWHRRLAVIFQDFVRYHLPARENIGFGSVAHLGDASALARAAAKSGADDVIEALPRGWDTVLSRQYTNGAELSGGEWQRVALARCHLAIEAGARLLVLDEPTASLDVREEATFYERFAELTQGLTTILISHRFSTVRAASRIVIVDDGRIREDGSHDELVAQGGIYAEMFRLQAGRYGIEPESQGSL